MGITGTRDAVSGDASGLVKRVREHTDLPVAVGLGVSNGAQAAQVAAFADGVIVGSAFVRRLLDDQGIPAIRELTAELSAACAGPHPSSRLARLDAPPDRRPARPPRQCGRYRESCHQEHSPQSAASSD